MEPAYAVADLTYKRVYAVVLMFIAILPLTAVPMTVARGPVRQVPPAWRYWMYTIGDGTEETDPYIDR